MGDRGSRATCLLLAFSVAVLSYMAAWVLYAFGAVMTFAAFHVEPPHWDTWPVRAGFGAVALIATVVSLKFAVATPSSRDGSIRGIRYGGSYTVKGPRLSILLAGAAVAVVLTVAARPAVMVVNEWRFVANRPPGWTKAEALDLGRRECAWLKSQPWGETGAWVRRADAMLGRELTYRGARYAVKVQRQAHHLLCPFQGFIHEHDFEREGD